MFKQRGGGVKGFLNNVKKKTALFLSGGFPYVGRQMKKIANEGEGTYIVHTNAGTLQLNNRR